MLDNHWVQRDIARLTHYLRNLDNSSSPTPLNDLTDIRICELSLASAFLAETQARLVHPAKCFWKARSPLVAHSLLAVQRVMFAAPVWSLERVLAACEDAESNLYLLIFRLEEIICELKRRGMDGLVVRRIRENSTHDTLELLKTAKIVLEKSFAFKLSDSQACSAVRSEMAMVLNAVRDAPGSARWYFAGKDMVNPSRDLIPIVHHVPLRLACIGVALLVVAPLSLRYTASKLAQIDGKSVEAALLSAKTFLWDDHLEKPMTAVFTELFSGNKRDFLNQAAADDARASLDRMVRDYNVDKGLSASNAQLDVESISKAYERAIKNPVWEAATGDLPRLALIQAQVIKAETLALANQMDIVLAENRVMGQLLAMVPAFGLLAGLRFMGRRLYRLVFDHTLSYAAAQRAMAVVLDTIERLLIVEEDGPSLIATFSLDGFESEDDDSFSESENIRLLGDPVLRARRHESGRCITYVHELAAMLRSDSAAGLVGEARERVCADCESLLHRQGLSSSARRAVLALMRRELEC